MIKTLETKTCLDTKRNSKGETLAIKWGQETLQHCSSCPKETSKQNSGLKASKNEDD